MELGFNAYPTTFKALYIAPTGQLAINYQEGEYIKKMQERRANDKYTDGVIISRPNEYGHYLRQFLHIKDKVTGETYLGPFEVDTPAAHHAFRAPDLKTEDGQIIPGNVAFIRDSRGKTKYFSFANEDIAERFVYSTKGEYPCEHLGLDLLGALEKYYRDNFNNEKWILKDKYIDLIMLLRDKYGKPMHQIVPDIIKEENLLGRGREKDVYKIDNLPDYALCVIRDKHDPDKPITPFHQCFQTTSVTDSDLPIMMNDNGMYIKKCINGKSHSIPNWGKKFHGTEPLVYEDIKYFMNSLKELSEFPALSYVNFAKALQKLNSEFPSIRIDTINPNNILIDKDLQTIKIIDFGSEDNKLPPGMARPINGLSDMEAILCDSMMYTRYYDMATDEDKAKLDEYAKNIIKKCGVAAKVTNIGNFPLNTERYVSDIDERMPLKEGGTRLEKLKAFKKHFKEFLSKEIVTSSLFGDLEAVLKKTEQSFNDESQTVLKKDNSENLSSNAKNDEINLSECNNSEDEFEKTLSQLPKEIKREVVEVYGVPKKDSLLEHFVKNFKGLLYPITKFLTRKKCIKVVEDLNWHPFATREEFYSDGTREKMVYKPNNSLAYMLGINKDGKITRVVKYDWSWHGVHNPKFRVGLDTKRLFLRLCTK